ncbi:hypothetical protein [Candidatus Methylacidithermus pantelleriae]|uniref:hypothetical protein n=1 Tax=Candidatus Methylacidithermus pantelleriae TaxID=2744239 RepID=UPI00157DA193|nr:hypothetical protein [Candidatus Methylacidithermus pantelleriae]
MNELRQVIETFSQPEYVHTILNPLPSYGLLVALVGLLCCAIFRTRAGQIACLILVILTSGSAGLVRYYGEEGYDRVKSMTTRKEEAWLEAHKKRGESPWFWSFYVTAAFALLALVFALVFPKISGPLTSLTLLSGLLSVGVAAWISHAGGLIRHPEFYQGPPPEAESATPLAPSTPEGQPSSPP